MKTLAVEGRMGASGDMLCGALLAVGADPSVLDPVEAVLDVRYRIGSTRKAGVDATTVDVVRADDDTRAEGSGPARTYPEVVDVVEGMELSSAVERDALAVFRRLGVAEASVHGTDLHDTHFHEVGADDAVADVVGACLLFADLDVDRVMTTPLATGDGTVSTGHGTYPVPAPAVAAIAAEADWSIRGGPVARELLTPTGAALLAEFADGVDRLPTLDVHATGYGAGDADVSTRPNVLRALLGDARGSLREEPISVLETNLDDATPEVIGSLQETLAEVGALDVTVLSTTTKKSRPGHLIKVVVAPEDAARVARRLAEETGTLGVREGRVGHRWVADRTVEAVAIDVGGRTHDVRVKVASDADGRPYDVSAEYDDALAVARETELPVREVMRRAEAAASRSLES
jgi:uncharacterized protein (TIGR00299 family) protein